MPPLIGIPQCLDESGRWRPNRATQYLDRTYAQAVEAAGGTPIFLPVQRDVAELVRRLDGLLLPGGDDFPPPHAYPGKVHFEAVSETQLDFDRRLLLAAQASRLPILAICYGMQLLALLHGGSLHYDIVTDVPDAGEHRLPEAEGSHPIRVTEGSRLAAILGAEPGPVNSLHHQAVAEAGDLVVAARADDGLIEAVEAGGDAFCIGVQWHPEKQVGPHRDRLLNAFVAAGRAAGHTG
jgi:putative glutamine amidotransferase